MADFDPDAFLAKHDAKPKKAGKPQSTEAEAFDPDAFLAKHDTAPVAAPAQDIPAGPPDAPGTSQPSGQQFSRTALPSYGTGDKSVGTAAVRGPLDYLTFGHADEAAAGIEALANPRGLPGSLAERYRQIRDDYRNRYAATEQAHPLVYHGAGLAASIATPIPGMAEAANASRLARIGKVAGYGALASEGHSTADLTKGEVIPLLADTGAGAALGTALGTAGSGVGALATRIASGAPGRLAKRMLGDTLHGVGAKIAGRTEAAAGKEGEFIQRVLIDPDNEKVMGSLMKNAEHHASHAIPAVEQKVTQLHGQQDAIYGPADAALGGGISAFDVLKPLNVLWNRLKGDAGKAEVAPLVEKKLNTLIGAWKQRNGGTLEGLQIPLREVRQIATDWGRKAFRNAEGVNPSVADSVGRDVYGAVVDSIDSAVERAKAAGAPVDLERLHYLNGQTRLFLNFQDALEAKAAKQTSGREHGHITEFLHENAVPYLTHLAGLGALGFHEHGAEGVGLASIGAIVTTALAKKGARAADRAMAGRLLRGETAIPGIGAGAENAITESGAASQIAGRLAPRLGGSVRAYWLDEGGAPKRDFEPEIRQKIQDALAPEAATERPDRALKKSLRAVLHEPTQPRHAAQR